MQCVSAVAPGLTRVSGFPLEFRLARLMKLQKGFPRAARCCVGLQERRRGERRNKTEEREGLMEGEWRINIVLRQAQSRGRSVVAVGVVCFLGGGAL